MIVLFTGPSLPPAEVPALPGLSELRVLPPAAQGDVYRAARERPWGIGIVDGFFEHVPSIWHKEILWAMSEGIHVFGASSMGALRAAELADFGMVGVGTIFEQYRAGALTADDEVALTHLPAEHGYRRVSEALVDMRATVEAAAQAGICEPALAARLIELARRRFYPERAWPAVLADARAAGEEPRALDALEAWLPGGRVDQKRRDALALLEAMRAARAARPGPLRAGFAFQHTDLWEQALGRIRAEPRAAGADPDASAVLDELRLAGDEQRYALAVQGALLRALAEEAAARSGLEVTTELVQRTATEFRRAHGLYTGPLTSAWLAEQGLDPETFVHMMKREAKLRWIEAVSEPERRRHLADQLRAMSCHGQLHARALAKQAALARAGLCAADLAAGDDDDAALLRWYFEARLGRPVPDDVADYAERFGFGDPGALLRALRIERWYATRG
ncbi:MAG TPA: TfuA-like protein [Kofleriaceae bacterium]|nr:TfuA-like protein [Kofleriaceae bacterium]